MLSPLEMNWKVVQTIKKLKLTGPLECHVSKCVQTKLPTRQPSSITLTDSDSKTSYEQKLQTIRLANLSPIPILSSKMTEFNLEPRFLARVDPEQTGFYSRTKKLELKQVSTHELKKLELKQVSTHELKKLKLKQVSTQELKKLELK